MSLVVKSVFLSDRKWGSGGHFEGVADSPSMGWLNSPVYFEVLEQAQYLNFINSPFKYHKRKLHTLIKWINTILEFKFSKNA